MLQQEQQHFLIHKERLYEPGSLKVEVSNVAGSKWKKGGYMKCKVSVNFKGITTLFNEKKSFELVMAIEKPDDAKNEIE